MPEHDQVPLLSMNIPELGNEFPPQGQTVEAEHRSKRKRRRFWLVCCLIGTACLFGIAIYVAPSKLVRPYTDIVMYGDSYTDTCWGWVKSYATADEKRRYSWEYCPEPPLGRSTMGLSWPELLASKIDPNTKLTNYARSGANCNTSIFGGISPDYGLQMTQSLQHNAVRRSKDSLSVLFASSANEWTRLAEKMRSGNGEYFDPLPLTQSLVACMMNRIQWLHDNGAGDILVFQFFPIYVLRFLRPYDAWDEARAKMMKAFHFEGNRLLAEQLALFKQTHSVNIELFPISDRFHAIIRDPQVHLAVSEPTCLDADDRLLEACGDRLSSALFHASELTYKLMMDEIALMVNSRLRSP